MEHPNNYLNNIHTLRFRRFKYQHVKLDADIYSLAFAALINPNSFNKDNPYIIPNIDKEKKGNNG